MFRIGDQIGSYVLKKQIGSGAFGVVWLAEETTFLTSHKVALKLPSQAMVNIEAIRQEAFLWEQVKGHPNILPIIKADIVDDQIYIASEYAPDGSLADWLKNHQGTAPNMFAAIEMTKGVLAGLAHLHSKSVIHRDLKPDNILLQGEIPRIADFGIARLLKESHSSQIAGTPSFMAPEGFNGIRSEQTDIWAAGVIFYQLVTGLLPYPQTDLMALMKAIVYEEPNIDKQKIPEKLRFIIYKALEKNVSNRYQTVSAMLGDLRKINSAAFENTFVAATIPDIKLSTADPDSHLVTAAQEAEQAEITLQMEQAQTTGEKNSKTQLLEQPPDTSAVPKNNRYLKLGGGILAAAALIGGTTYMGINLSNTSPTARQPSSIIAASNTNPAPPKDNLYNRSLWAEWALMLEDDEYDKIVSEATAEIERNPNNLIAYRMRATAYYNLENPEPARMDIREVLRLSTNPAAAEEYESRCYALKVINKPDEALENCTKAIELDSQMALAYNIRGTIYHQKQMYDLAVTEYSKAIELSPRRTFFQNRAISYKASGNKKLAAKDEKEAASLENYRAENPNPTSKNPNAIRSTPKSTAINPVPRPESRKTPNPKSASRKNKRMSEIFQ